MDLEPLIFIEPMTANLVNKKPRDATVQTHKTTERLREERGLISLQKDRGLAYFMLDNDAVS